MHARLGGYRERLLLVAYAAALGLNFVLFFLNRTMPEYVDESDNLLGGRLIAGGYRLYVDYFSQHMPAPYLAAAIATVFGAADLVTYRAFFAVFVTVVLGAAAWYFRTRLSAIFLLSLVGLIAIGHPIFSGYMLLADHLFALALLLILLFVLAHDVSFDLPQQVAISLCAFVALHSTLISMYPLLLVALYYIIRKRPSLREGGRFALILALPHVLLVLVLMQQNSLGALVEDALVFNQRYYSHYDIGSDPWSILSNSLREFSTTLIQYLRPTGLREIETNLLIANILAIAVAWRWRGPHFGVFYLALVILSRMRGAGYHGSPYFLVSFVSVSLVLAYAVNTARQVLRAWRSYTPRQWLLPAGLLVYVGLVGLFVRDVGGFYRRLPRGQDLGSPYALVVTAATGPTDRIWVAPNGPYVYLQAHRLPASRYSYYQPWLSDSPEISAAILRDLQAVQPPIVVYEADKHIEWSFPLPTPAEYGGQVYDYLRVAYEPASANDQLLRNVYLRRDQADSLRVRLAERGYPGG